MSVSRAWRTFHVLSLVLAGMSVLFSPTPRAGQQPAVTPPTMTEILAKSKPSDWRPLDPENTLYLELETGRVVIELAPVFAPNHVANVKQLARDHYFDGLVVLRVQDNYVTQWGDPNGEKPALARKVQNAKARLPGEFDRAWDRSVPFEKLPDGDVYAREVGFSDGFPAARDPRGRRIWLAHTYGMVGAGRDVDPDSGGGTELYVVIGQAPRHLDRNTTLLGRVLRGMELLSSLPRGTEAMGFYAAGQRKAPIRSVRVASDVPAGERSSLEVLRTDTPTFRALVESRRNRSDPWFRARAGRVELANVPVPVRETPVPGNAAK